MPEVLAALRERSRPGRRSSGFVGHAATYAIGNVIGRLVGFLMLPIYTRFLSPADYGVVGLLTFALAVLEPLFGARLGRAIPKFYFDTSDERRRSGVVWSALILTGSVSVITAVAIALLREPAAHLLFGSDRYALDTGLFAVNMVSLPIEDTGMLYLRLRERSRLFLALSVGKLLLQVALNLLFVVYWRMGVLGVILCGIISSLTMAAGLTIYVAAHNAPVIDRNMMRRMLGYCWPLWFSGIAGLYVTSSGALFLRLFDSLSDVGLLELALRFGTAVTLLVWTPFFQHWEPMSYRYYKDPDAHERFQVAFISVSTLLFAAGLGVSIFAGPVIRIMAAPEFYAASGAVPLLTLGLILSSLVSFFHFSFLVTERTELHSLSGYITAAILTILYFVLIPKYKLQGAVIAQCLTFAINFAYVRFWTKRHYDPGFDLIPICALVVIAALAYVCANVLLQSQHAVIDLAGKSGIFVLASVCMGVVGLRAIRSSSPAAYGSIQLSLRRAARGSAR